MSGVAWKGGAKCAVMATVNLDAEFFWLALSPDCINRPKTMSMGQYGMTRGLPRLLDLFDAFGIRATFFTPGRTAETYPDAMREIVARGHEAACHGYRHENFALLSVEEQREAMKLGVAAIERVCGVRPRGFRAPEGELTLDTLRIAREFGITYSSDLSDDDRPYRLDLQNGDSILEIQIHWALYDLPYFAFNYRPAFPKGQGRIAGYSRVLHNFLEEYRGYRERGLCYVLQLDPQTIGTPGRIGLLRELLEEIRRDGDAWFATGSEMADFMARARES